MKKTKTEISPATLSLFEVIQMEHMIRFKDSLVALRTLTPQERSVAAGIWKDFSDQQIADALHLHPATVRGHIQNTLKKLGAKSRVGVAVAFERGLHDTCGRVSPWV